MEPVGDAVAPGALPVVLVHGIRVSGTMWRPVQDLVATHRSVAAPDLPGHGRRRGEPFTIDAAVDTVAGAIERLGGQALVVGHSLGGYVGIATAGRHPDLVAGLVAVACTARPRGLGLGSYRQFARVAARLPRTVNRLSRWAFRQMLPDPVASALVAGGLASEAMPGAVAAVAGSDPVAALRAYPGPVWLVNPARDPFRRDEQEFLRACRDGRLIVLPRRNHLTSLADPAALARTILDAATVTQSQVGPRR